VAHRAAPLADVTAPITESPTSTPPETDAW